MKVRSLILALAAVMGLTFASCEKEGSDGSFQLSESNAIVEVGLTLQITASSGSNDVTTQATWTSSDDKVAEVEDGLITGVSKGSATITCSYNGATATCNVKVIGASAGSVLLNGSDYYVFAMNETAFDKISSKVTSDMRPNGSYNDDGTLPEGVTRPIQIWNPSGGADAPRNGQDSFGGVDEWFSVAALPAGSDDWDNICGGLAILSSDTERGKLVKLTTDHVLAITLKGNYTQTNNLKITMFTPTGEDVPLFDIQKTTGAENDGDWELFTMSYADLLSKGIDLTQPITADTWFPYTFTAAGGSSRVDIDCVMFYVPAK